MAEEKKEKDKSEFVVLLFLAIVLDFVFRQFPPLNAIQPILPVALLAGVLYGTKRGIATGVLAYAVSNFLLFTANVFSSTLFFVQLTSAVIAGALGGVVSEKGKPSVAEFVGLAVVSAIVFEGLNNLLLGASGSRISGYYYLEGTALASALHLISAVLLALLLSSLLDKK